MKRIDWPDGKNFVFTVFDDTDNSTLNNTKPVYSFLIDNGFLTTKSVWTIPGEEEGTHKGTTCHDFDYLNWLKSLNKLGFEIGYHMASYCSTKREYTDKSLEEFKKHLRPPILLEKRKKIGK